MRCDEGSLGLKDFAVRECDSLLYQVGRFKRQDAFLNAFVNALLTVFLTAFWLALAKPCGFHIIAQAQPFVWSHALIIFGLH